MINTDSLGLGEHRIKIYTRHIVEDTISEQEFAVIPFWK